MYNLLVTARTDDWTGAPFEIEKERCVHAGEYTPEPLAQKYGALDDASFAELQAFPALFAYETSNKQNARLGILKKVRTRQVHGGEVRLEYEIFSDLPPISPETILRLQWELDVTNWEMGHSHWAVKDIDLLHELQEAGILTNAQAASYGARLASATGGTPTPAVESASRNNTKQTRESVIISYSHKDKKFLDALLTHLKPLERAGRVSVWSDKQIKAGSEWTAQIDVALKAARVAVLLVTKDFLASDFIYKNELGPLLRRAKEEGVIILWVLVRDCNWKMTDLSSLQAAYPTEKALANLNSSRDAAWVKICEKIATAAGPALSGADLTSPSMSLPAPKLNPQGYYVEEGTGRKICGLCWEKHSRRMTLLEDRRQGPASALVSGGVSRGYSSWTELLKCPDCKTEYAPIHRSHQF